MTNVVTIGGNEARQAAQPVPEIVNALEKFLEMAKAGKIQRVAVCWIEDDGTPMDMMAPGGNVFTTDIVSLVGSLELCKTTIATQIALNHLEPQ